jgi:hypothetical protein
VTAIHQRNRLSGFLAFMVKHQYKVMFVSFVVGCIFVVFHLLLAFSWFFSRLTLLLAIYAFVPAGCVLLAHLRERFLIGWYFYWDKSNVAWTTRRAPKVEKVELIVLGVLGSLILIFLIVVVFFLAND